MAFCALPSFQKPRSLSSFQVLRGCVGWGGEQGPVVVEHSCAIIPDSVGRAGDQRDCSILLTSLNTADPNQNTHLNTVSTPRLKYKVPEVNTQYKVPEVNTYS